MVFQYKRTLVIGGTSGIGEALASRLVQEGSKVIVVGRRQERLDAFVKTHGADKAAAVPLDVTEMEKIPDFAARVIRDFPDLDCVLLNSGIGLELDFSKPDTVDGAGIRREFDINYISYLLLTKAFLPHLLAKSTPSALMYITGGLAIIPLPRTPNYSATKAALHHFILSLRVQLRDSPIKVIEIFPPAVDTDFHPPPTRESLKGHAMLVDEFTERVYQGLAADKDQIPVGHIPESLFESIEGKRQDAFNELVRQFS